MLRAFKIPNPPEGYAWRKILWCRSHEHEARFVHKRNRFCSVEYTAGKCEVVDALVLFPDAPLADVTAPRQQPPAAREDGGVT